MAMYIREQGAFIRQGQGTGYLADGSEIRAPIHVDTIRAALTLFKHNFSTQYYLATNIKYYFVPTPTNHKLQVKDRFCLVFAEL